MKPLILACLLFLSACTTQSGEQAGTQTDTVAVPAPQDSTPARSRPSLPVQKVDTVVLEGTPEPITLKLYRSPEGFPLTFHTYYPEDMIAESASAGEGDGVHFIANFGGIRNDGARLVLFVYPETVSSEEARQTIGRIVQQNGATRRRPKEFDWSSEEYRFSGKTNGYLLAGERAGRTFYWMAQYPPEYSEGFGPRARFILENFEYE